MTTMPCVFINHGGGPMPLLGQQPDVSTFLSGYLETLPHKPTCIAVVTAHWETTVTTVSAGETHDLLFDYSGFPDETYSYQYPAPGCPRVAQKIAALLAAQGLLCELDATRGWDHGVFVPLLLMAKDADIPVVSISVLKPQSGAAMAKVGAALAPLRDEGVLFVGSGASFHNFKYLFTPSGKQRRKGEATCVDFDRWLVSTFTLEDDEPITEDERRLRVETNAWQMSQGGRNAHPDGAAEHLMPLFFIFGAGGYGPAGRRVGPIRTEGFTYSQFEFE